MDVIMALVDTQNLLNIVLALGAVIISAAVALTSYYLIRALKSITRLADDLEDTASDINYLKNKVKFKALTAASAVFATVLSRLIKKRG